MYPNKKEQHKLQKMKQFVSAARDIIAEEGFPNLSVRKMAEKAGFHNSTIYFYFSDADLLIALASVRSFAEYSGNLARLSAEPVSNTDAFYRVWYYFCKSCFHQPFLYHQFFFGKYRNNLTDILNQYYELFPEERQDFSPAIEKMFYAGNFRERCLHILQPIVGSEGTRVTPENSDMVNDLIIFAFENMLNSKMKEPELDSCEITNRFLSMLHYLVDV